MVVTVSAVDTNILIMPKFYDIKISVISICDASYFYVNFDINGLRFSRFGTANGSLHMVSGS